MSWLIAAVGMVYENGTFAPENLAKDVGQASGDVMVLVGLAIGAAIALGLIYAIYLLMTQGS